MKPMRRQAQHAGRDLVMNAKQQGLVSTIAWAVWAGVKRGPTVWAVRRLVAAALLLAGLAALGGRSLGGDAGAILNNGTLTLTSSALSSNSAGHGGGIYNGGTLTLTNSTLSGNSAVNANNASGGGIHNEATATLTGSTVSGN